MKSLKLMMMVALTILSIAAFAQDTTTKKTKGQESEKAKYVCPSHLEVKLEKPGKCPRCGADLKLSPKEKMKMKAMKTYTCPMHPDVTHNKSGKCPTCVMDMKETEKTVYVCPMHPEITSDKPGKCSLCNMDLKEKKDSSSNHRH